MSNVLQLKNAGGTVLMPQTMEEAIKFSEIMAGSDIVPKDYQKKPGNILVAIQWGMEVGIQPLQAMQNIAVINGRPSIWGDALLGLVRASNLLEEISEDLYADGDDVDEWFAKCTVTRKGEQPVVREFSVKDAKTAGLWGKQGPWQTYPKRMLQMRARGFALRDTFADVLKGMHVAEEAQDMPAEMKDITPAEEEKKGVEGVKKRLSKARGKSKPKAKENDVELAGPTLAEVSEAIAKATTLDELEAVSDDAAKLDNGDRDKARAAFAARKKELSKPPLKDGNGPSTQEIRDLIAKEISQGAPADATIVFYQEMLDQLSVDERQEIIDEFVGPSAK